MKEFSKTKRKIGTKVAVFPISLARFQRASTFPNHRQSKLTYHPCTVRAGVARKLRKPSLIPPSVFPFVNLLFSPVASKWNLGFFQVDDSSPDLFSTFLERFLFPHVLCCSSRLAAYRWILNGSIVWNL